MSLASRLNSTAIHLLRRIARDDAADGVTGARLSALSVLVYGGPMPLGALARRERVSPPTMTRIVDALVRDRLVTRDEDPTDRRAVRLAATAAGRELMDRGRARRVRNLAADLETLPETELETLERAVDVLERLTARPQSRIPSEEAAP